MYTTINEKLFNIELKLLEKENLKDKMALLKIFLFFLICSAINSN